MGTLSSILTPLATAVSFAKPFIGALQKNDTLGATYQQSNADAALKKQQNLLTYQNAETDRLQRLRRALSTQQAKAGAQGVADGQGSGEAVLQGLNEASDITRQQNTADYNLTNRSIEQNTTQQQNINLLQRQQLRQNTALGLITDNF